jgi:biotin-(acetyl-CoA carboxylase) ligase
MNFEEMEQKISDYAKARHAVLDYTAQSIEVLNEIMEAFYERVNQCSDEEGDEILAEWAECFGVYIGETLLRVHLSEKGFAWALNGEVPVLQRGNDRLYPVGIWD